MKKLVFLLFIGLMSSNLVAQMTEAEIFYDMSMESEDPMMQQQMAMFSGSTMKVSFKDNFFRNEIDMGGMMSTVIIADGKSESGLMLMDMMGMKMAIPMNKEELKEQRGDEESDEQTVEVTDETKEILGYTCKKVIITDSDGNQMTLYVTDEISPKNNQNKYGAGVDGFPLEIESTSSETGAELVTKLVATVVNKKVKDKSAFDMSIPDGYDQKTMEDLQMMGQ